MSVCLCYIHPGTVDTVFHLSVVNLLRWDREHSGHITGHETVETPSSRTAQGRNELSQVVLDSGYDWMLLCDTDQGWAPDSLDRLLASAEPLGPCVISGFALAQFPTGHSKYGSVTYEPRPGAWKLGDEGWDTITPEGLTEVDGTGTALTLYHRDVLAKAGAEPFLDRWEDSPMGGDLAFCMRAKAAGYRVFVDGDVGTSHRKHHYLVT